MSGAANPSSADFLPPPAGEILGHPLMYEGMRAMLAVHVAAAFFAHLGVGADAEASRTYGGYTAMV